VSVEDLILWALVGLPLAAVICFGLAARSFVGGDWSFWIWVVLAAVLAAAWVPFVMEAP
jgi:hypothetical protein